MDMRHAAAIQRLTAGGLARRSAFAPAHVDGRSSRRCPQVRLAVARRVLPRRSGASCLGFAGAVPGARWFCAGRTRSCAWD